MPLERKELESFAPTSWNINERLDSPAHAVGLVELHPVGDPMLDHSVVARCHVATAHVVALKDHGGISKVKAIFEDS